MRHRLVAGVQWAFIVAVVLFTLAAAAVTAPVVFSPGRNSIPSEVGEP